ncbi:MAG: site-specific DNA-methyltransferase [Gemmataceae bacterium]|nr:site-specific DNA-methyltransferase [Gemmataceae bacterium]
MAKSPKKPAASVPVDAHKHVADTRPNIPTRETAAFADDAPQTFVAHRDRSLDPQLVWKGKDEQDAKPLEVPAVPIHVQEKVHPQAIIEAVKSWAKQGKPVYDLFADFNGLDDFSKRLEFYQHDQHWTNRLILGDSLLVMASLAEKERLRGKVQCVYFDPPYGIKFGSNWQVSTRKRDVKDAKADDLTRQPEQIKAFRDTWELGIHSYLSYMRDRLAAARDLLTESGSIFVQIGDENVHLVRCLMDEVFGSENHCGIITYTKTTTTTGDMLPATTDFILWYAKVREHAVKKFKLLYSDKAAGSEGAATYGQVELEGGVRRSMTAGEKRDPSALPPNARQFRLGDLTSPRVREARTGYFPISLNGKEYLPRKGEWKTHKEGMEKLKLCNRLASTGEGLYYVRFLEDFPALPLNNNWDDTVVAGFASDKRYIVETNTKVVQRCLLMTTDPGDLVLDPTCGSGTTAYVAEQWGRRWITIDTSRVALALTRTRLMAARFPYYLLADSPEGRKKQAALTGAPPDPTTPPTKGDMHKGFVYRVVPHVTLKSIANNPDIKEGMTREQIDAAIAKHAETETLFDQPYEDKDIVRLTGPFTVESLSPHRALGKDEGGRMKDEMKTEDKPGSDLSFILQPSSFLSMILDNLRKAGVKGTDKSQRITFARLDPFPGELIQAEGETDTGAAVRVCIGPEFGALGDADIKKAALESIKGSKCDLLLVCAFAFEASVHEQTAELTKEIKLGKLAVLPVRMNPDLAMGDELLKKTGAGNLFTVFGEPDLELVVKNGQVVVTIRGVDVFDPSTGAVRTGDTDDIACWFIDTDYDGQSFFVRHAYFLYGGKDTKDGPYDKLKKALRAEIDEGEWSKLYSATSQPFDLPKSGKIAVKVINHFGDEVLKVYPVPGLGKVK